MTRRDVDLLVLDLGGVFIELVGVETMLQWCPHLPTTDALWHEWLHSPAVRAYESGRLSTEAFGDAVVAEFGLPVAPADFIALFEHWPRHLFPGAHALLAELRTICATASASNTNALHWQRFEREFDLPARFDHNFPSFAVGKLKPDADYFEHILAETGVPAGRALFVDDNVLNVEAARRCGLQAQQVRGTGGLREAMVALGLLGRREA